MTWDGLEAMTTIKEMKKTEMTEGSSYLDQLRMNLENGPEPEKLEQK